MKLFGLPVLFLISASLSGCASTDQLPDPSMAATVPASWHSSLPHGGQVAQLSAWWRQFDDPMMSRLILAGEAAAPSLASARARIEQARAGRVASGAGLLPSLSGGAGVTRGRHEAGQPVASSGWASLDLAWEIDLFGGLSAGAKAAQARLEGAQADWHDASGRRARRPLAGRGV